MLFVTVLIGGLVVLALGIGWSLLQNPFSTETVDRSPPPVLLSLQDIAEFRAARGNFEVLVDLEQDVKYLPAALAGKRVLFIGVGAVDAYVDFSTLDDSAVRISDDGTSVTITMPPPQLAAPTIDPTLSRVVDTDKGLFDRLGELISGDQASEQDLYVAAAAKMSDAAAAAGLQAQAEENTRKLLEGLLTGLGFETIQVNFTAEAPVAQN